MKRFAIAAAWCGLISAGLLPARSVAKEPAPAPSPTVQLAILLDTSSSMDGLIAQAKTQLWSIVNEFVRARKNGRVPAVQVALFEYGKSSLSASEGFVRLILPLTDDLDRISEELFALKTNGGEEYCGWVLRESVNKLSWSPSREVYKAIFIAGNEPFTQGPVDFHASCKAAIERGIFVNTIHCGALAEGQRTGWKDGALLADGQYLNIDQNQKVVDIPTPQDAEIARLGVELNKTYLPYGRMGAAGQARQVAQDANALSASATAGVSRSVSKGNALYCNDAWDLIDAIKNGKCKIEELKPEELPPALQKLDAAGRKAKVEEAAKQRATIQNKINDLNKDRVRFLAEEQKKQKTPLENTLEQAIVKAIRDQAGRCKFTFE